MLSGVASLLFGSSSTEPEKEVPEVDVPTRDAELGWVVVDLPKNEKSSRRRKRNSGVEDSPMENLLIEHPSMSVYNSYGGDSTGENSNQSESSSDVEMEDSAVAHRTRRQVVHQAPRRPHAVAARAGIVAHIQCVKNAQRKQQSQATRYLSRKNTDKSNRVRAYESMGKSQSKHNRAVRPSGRMSGRLPQRKF